MGGFIKKLLGRQEPVAASPALGTVSGESAGSATSREAIRRQVVQMALRDALRQHSVPAASLECQVVKTAGPGPGLHLLLTIRQEETRILGFASAFQQSVLAQLRKFDAGVSDWLHGVSWQLADKPADRPAATAVIAPAAVPAAVEPEVAGAAERTEAAASKAAAREDLERMFAIRDEELKRGRSDGEHDDFQMTQPAFEPTRPAER
jgi:hypothetical protein